MNKQEKQKKNRILGFVERVKSKPKTHKEYMEVEQIEEKEAQLIKDATGRETLGFTRVLHTDHVRHIINRHGKDSNGQNGADQVDATPELIAHATALLSKSTEIKPNSIAKKGDMLTKVDCKKTTAHVVQEIHETKMEVWPVTIFFKKKKVT